MTITGNKTQAKKGFKNTNHSVDYVDKNTPDDTSDDTVGEGNKYESCFCCVL